MASTRLAIRALTLCATLIATDIHAAPPSRLELTPLEEPRAFATLEALIEARGRDDAKPLVHPLVVAGALPLEQRESTLREVQVVGARDTSDKCQWYLVARDDTGWVDLGRVDERRGPCDADPLDGGRATGAVLSAPRAVPGGFVVDAKDFDWHGVATAKPEFLRCRVGDEAIACVYRFSDRPRPELATIGLTARANLWLARPTAIERGGRGNMRRFTFGGGRLAIVDDETWLGVRWQPPEGKVGEAGIWWIPRIFSVRAVTPTQDRHGIVHVVSKLVERGPKLDLTTMWVDLFVPPTASRPPLHLRFITGVSIRSRMGLAGDASPVAGWQRELGVDADGVGLVELDGPLAWFRGTGRYTWDELVTIVQRWRASASEAFAAEAKVALEARGGKAIPRYRVDRTLDLLPGYIEPVDARLLDEAQEMHLLSARP